MTYYKGSIDPDKEIYLRSILIFLPINLNMCFECSKNRLILVPATCFG